MTLMEALQAFSDWLGPHHPVWYYVALFLTLRAWFS